jgi:hypothetical protein
VLRANDEAVAIYLGPKQIALHRRCWGIGEDIEAPSHRSTALEMKGRASQGALPCALSGLGKTGIEYFHILSATRRSIRREIVRLTMLCELFSERLTAEAMREVMATGHVGAEYVEYVLRHKRGLVPSAAPLRLGDPELDALNFGEPDLSRYDQLQLPLKTLDPGELPAPEEHDGDE